MLIGNTIAILLTIYTVYELFKWIQLIRKEGKVFKSVQSEELRKINARSELADLIIMIVAALITIVGINISTSYFNGIDVVEGIIWSCLIAALITVLELYRRREEAYFLKHHKRVAKVRNIISCELYARRLLEDSGYPLDYYRGVDLEKIERDLNNFFTYFTPEYPIPEIARSLRKLGDEAEPLRE